MMGWPVVAEPTASLVMLARGFTRSYDRLHAAMAAQDDDETFYTLFETLSWLDSLLLRRDAGFRKEGVGEAGEVMSGLRYVRGRVHHQWLRAVELRTDVVHPPVPLGLDTRTRRIVEFHDPNVYLDWCWVPTSSLRGSGGRDEARRDAYDRRLAGQPVRFALGRFRDYTTLIDITSLS